MSATGGLWAAAPQPRGVVDGAGGGQSFNQMPTHTVSPGTSRVRSRPRLMPVTLTAWLVGSSSCFEGFAGVPDPQRAGSPTTVAATDSAVGEDLSTCAHSTGA